MVVAAKDCIYRLSFSMSPSFSQRIPMLTTYRSTVHIMSAALADCKANDAEILEKVCQVLEVGELIFVCLLETATEK